MSGQKNCFAAVTNTTHQFPDSTPRLGVQPGCQFVKKHNLRIVDKRKSDEQSLLLSSGQVHKPCVPFITETELCEQMVAVYPFLPIERSPKVYRFPHLYPLLQLCLL